MKILLLGANGQVGWELQRSLSILGEVIACDRQQANLENIPALRKLIREINPKIIVNAAAYTAVDKAETELDRARLINTDAVKAIAEEAKELGAWLVHYSTDYVFGDTKTSAYVESDPTHPKNNYGQTKAWGEEAIIASGCHYFIFRTSWVYAARGHNFVNTILKLAKERRELKIVADQVGAPTSAELIANVTAMALSQGAPSGIYHLTASGETSWYDFAKTIVEQASLSSKVSVIPISSAEYPLPAKRPLNSRLNTAKLRDTFGIVLPSWQTALKCTMEEILHGRTG